MKPAAFFFDLDGTLVDTETPWTLAIAAFLADRGVSAPVAELAPLVCGRSWYDIHAQLHRRYGALPPADPATDAKALRPYYDRVVTDPKSVVIPSSVAFLRKVASFAPVAIVSGSPRADVWDLARTCDVAFQLQFVLGTEDYTRGKPAPDCFLKAASMLEVDASECVVVEDSTAGVRAGRAAGMQVLALNRNRLVPQDFTGATWLVGDLSEIDVNEVFDPSGLRYHVGRVKDAAESRIQGLTVQVGKVKDAAETRLHEHLQDLTKWTTSRR